MWQDDGSERATVEDVKDIEDPHLGRLVPDHAPNE